MQHFIILGQRHLDYLINEFVEHYHIRRPHQAKNNRPLIRLAGKELPPIDDSLLTDGNRNIGCEERLDGFLKHYYRKAA